MDDNPAIEVADRVADLELQLARLTQMVQTGVKLETVSVEERQFVKDALSALDGGDVFNEAVAAQYQQAKQQQLAVRLEVQQLQDAVLDNVETWETASVVYEPFNFGKVPGEERKFIRLLAKDLGEVDWSTRSVKNWVSKLDRVFNENFVVSRWGRLAVVYNACSKSTQERLLAANFGTNSAVDTYNFISLVKTLGAMYASVNHTVIAQQELGRGRKQGGQESVICFLERVQEVFSQAYGPQVSWSAYHRTKLVEAVVTGVSSKKLVDLIATYQIPVPFSFIQFRYILVQYAQRVPQIHQEKAEVSVVMGPCFRC